MCQTTIILGRPLAVPGDFWSFFQTHQRSFSSEIQELAGEAIGPVSVERHVAAVILCSVRMPAYHYGRRRCSAMGEALGRVIFGRASPYTSAPPFGESGACCQSHLNQSLFYVMHVLE